MFNLNIFYKMFSIKFNRNIAVSFLQAQQLKIYNIRQDNNSGKYLIIFTCRELLF